MNGSHFLLDALRQEGIGHVFMVPGGLLDPFLEKLGEPTGVEAIVAAHEGGAAYMADGYARASGRFGVCLGIGGPGVANMVGAIAAAYADESPIFVVTGQVPTMWEGRGAFQDASPSGLNDIAFLDPITAYAREVTRSGDLPHHLHVALRTMLGLERRPVNLSLAKDIQSAEISDVYRPLTDATVTPPRLVDTAAASSLAQEMAGHKNIVLLCGNGSVESRASDAIVNFAETHHIPVATTLRAKGVMPEDHELSLGVFGYAGTQHATEALIGGGADLVLVLGSSLNMRDTMVWNEKLRPPGGVTQVDMDPAIFGRNFPVDRTIVGDVRSLVLTLQDDANLTSALSDSAEARRAWVSQIRSLDRHYDSESRTSDQTPIHPARVITDMRSVAPRNTVLVIDSGAHRAFAGHHWDAYGANDYISSTTLAPMGWAIAAGIGAKVARPNDPVAVVTGDGCMLMHGIEIQTAAAHGLPVIFVVLNNSALGNVYLRARNQSQSAGQLASLPTHDWVAFGKSLGAEGRRVDDPADLIPAFEQAFAHRGGPFILDLRTDKEAGTPITPWTKAGQEWIEAH